MLLIGFLRVWFLMVRKRWFIRLLLMLKSLLFGLLGLGFVVFLVCRLGLFLGFGLFFVLLSLVRFVGLISLVVRCVLIFLIMLEVMLFFFGLSWGLLLLGL